MPWSAFIFLMCHSWQVLQVRGPQEGDPACAQECWPELCMAWQGDQQTLLPDALLTAMPALLAVSAAFVHASGAPGRKIKHGATC